MCPYESSGLSQTAAAAGTGRYNCCVFGMKGRARFGLLGGNALRRTCFALEVGCFGLRRRKLAASGSAGGGAGMSQGMRGLEAARWDLHA